MGKREMEKMRKMRSRERRNESLEQRAKSKGGKRLRFEV
jgi:hypothetical protein